MRFNSIQGKSNFAVLCSCRDSRLSPYLSPLPGSASLSSAIDNSIHLNNGTIITTTHLFLFRTDISFLISMEAQASFLSFRLNVEWKPSEVNHASGKHWIDSSVTGTTSCFSWSSILYAVNPPFPELLLPSSFLCSFNRPPFALLRNCLSFMMNPNMAGCCLQALHILLQQHNELALLYKCSWS